MHKFSYFAHSNLSLAAGFVKKGVDYMFMFEFKPSLLSIGNGIISNSCVGQDVSVKGFVWNVPWELIPLSHPGCYVILANTLVR